MSQLWNLCLVLGPTEAILYWSSKSVALLMHIKCSYNCLQENLHKHFSGPSPMHLSFLQYTSLLILAVSKLQTTTRLPQFIETTTQCLAPTPYSLVQCMHPEAKKQSERNANLTGYLLSKIKALLCLLANS